MKKIKIPVNVLVKARDEWLKTVERHEAGNLLTKSGGCPICYHLRKVTKQDFGHQGICQHCPLHPEVCCNENIIHHQNGQIMSVPLYFRYKTASKPLLVDLAKECVAVLDRMIKEAV